MSSLPTKDDDAWQRLKSDSQGLSDGCSDSPDIHVQCCYLHDWAYRTGTNYFTGERVTRAEADKLLRDCMREFSPIGRFSIISRLYYWAVMRFGGLTSTARRTWPSDR